MSATRPSAGPELMLPGLREVYAAYVREADALPSLPGPLEAEVWTSARLGSLEAAAPHLQGRRAALGDLITSLRAAATPGARAFLRVLAAIGPAEARKAAGRAADALGDVPAAAWEGALGRVVPGQVWLIQEGPLDGDRLVCEFRYADAGTAGMHALAVRLSHGDVPAEVVIVGDVPALMGAARQAMQAELCVVQPYDPAAVGRRLRAALDGTAPGGTDLPEECYPALALARHRAALLPGG
ncbi:hypothetical protein [Actinomadura livida]|uniref:Uncharacterized protein n=1 Tax=Actinomadura livida TaxID=79909 RepID=A0A7W7ICJ8_9ACTN|nr:MULTISPECIES: hypothetical protein [Actinomadura]MBB4774496.1 hypothetical protein [Actinomadura catellatispora]GGT82140.1 hypothetical protein GCM10010208_00480 [Actinomadura livida]